MWKVDIAACVETQEGGSLLRTWCGLEIDSSIYMAITLPIEIDFHVPDTVKNLLAALVCVASHEVVFAMVHSQVPYPLLPLKSYPSIALLDLIESRTDPSGLRSYFLV